MFLLLRCNARVSRKSLFTNQFLSAIAVAYVFQVNFAICLWFNVIFFMVPSNNERKLPANNQNLEKDPLNKPVAFRQPRKGEGFQFSRLSFNPNGNCMFKVSNKNTRTRCKICSMLTITTPAIGVALMSLLLNLNIFHTLPLCFYC